MLISITICQLGLVDIGRHRYDT